MAKIVVLGAGIAGHTASALLKKKLGKKHEVVVVTPNAWYHWIPSNIWVGVGRMTVDQVRFRLDKRYAKAGIVYKQAKAVSFHPEGDNDLEKGFVTIEMVEAPTSLAIFATIGLAPVPVPPPRPAKIKTISVPSKAALMS